MRAWLTALREAPRAVHDVAARSYWHPNGFAKLVLRDGGGHGGTVRLHVWPAREDDGTPRGDTNAHGHRWDFASAVIAGDGLHVAHFAEDPDGPTYEHYLFRGGDDLTWQGHARLASSAEKVRPYADLYVCGTDVVHTIDPCGRDVVATLLVQGPVKHPTTSVYRRPGPPLAPHDRPVSDDDVRGLLRTVLDRL